MFQYYACWMNGSEVQSGPYSEYLGWFEDDEKAKVAFLKWRKENPERYDWKHTVWLVDESQNEVR